MGVRRTLFDLIAGGRRTAAARFARGIQCVALLVRSGAHWRMLPHDLPPWSAAYQQTQRWFKAGCFEAMAHDLRMLLRLAAGREAAPQPP